MTMTLVDSAVSAVPSALAQGARTDLTVQQDSEIARLRERLAHHPVYRAVSNVGALRVFAEHHAFAVWDFMCIVKQLQQNLTCLTVPWVPRRDARAARFINEIVVGEECDELPQGGYASHFELYVAAMREIGANVSVVERFIELLRSGADVSEALERSEAPASCKRFVMNTFSFLQPSTPLHVRAAVLFYGREDLIPSMFRSMVAELVGTAVDASTFVYYLDRHIQIDGESHSIMAQELLSSLCGTDPARWQECRDAAATCLRARDVFWNDILAALNQR